MCLVSCFVISLEEKHYSKVSLFNGFLEIRGGIFFPYVAIKPLFHLCYVF